MVNPATVYSTHPVFLLPQELAPFVSKNDTTHHDPSALPQLVSMVIPLDKLSVVLLLKSVLSMTTLAEIDRLKAFGLHHKDLKEHKDLRRASVLVPLFLEGDALLRVLLTQRPLHLKSHPGEVAFPGGKQDPEDKEDDIETALREAWEEVGLAREYIQPICRLSTIESRNGLCVTPIVGLVEPASAMDQLQISKDEVEEAFTVPLDYFLDQNGNLSDQFDVPWSGGIFTVRTYYYVSESEKRFKIWGLTAHILHQVASLAFENAASSSCATVCMEGKLWIWDSVKEFWSEKYYIIEDGMLHQYSSQQEATRKNATATKKNRLPLTGARAVVVNQEGDRHVFEISALEGRIRWRLAAASPQLRDRWMAATTF